ncbi:MAG: chemotaxis protein CheW [Gammaproteobacteria bacterium]|nr:chemotaxis protein CheW [Gammaproteobacteria bacterium]
MSEKPNSNLLEQKSALVSYLDDMLQNATETAEAVNLETAVSIDNMITARQLVLDSEEQQVSQPEMRRVNEPRPSAPTEDSVESPDDAESTKVDSVMTSDMFPVQCLMFKVGSNMLSIPLTELNSVVEWQHKLNRPPGEPDWMLGILRHRNNNVRVINSAAILQIQREEEISCGFVLVLGDERWGISCDQIDKVITLNYADVQWHKNQTNRIALGTIRSSLSTLLSSRGIISRLSNS